MTLTSIGLNSCDDGDDNVVTDQTVTLTSDEKSDLLFSREEEKLARDVYTHFYAKYGLNVFNNISQSEQKHMDEILTLLNKYGLEDPVSATPGVFNNPDLQTLYNDLIKKGDSSQVKALIVGATIEDVDIFDLDRSIANATQSDIQEIYTKLKCGSRNHMRAFTKQLDSEGETYTPQYISQAEYDAIINGAHESCGG